MLRLYLHNTGVSFFNISSEFVQTFCPIRYRGAISHSAVACTAATAASFFASKIQKVVNRCYKCL